MAFLLRRGVLGRTNAIFNCRHLAQRPPSFGQLSKLKFAESLTLSRPFFSTARALHPRPYPHRQYPSNDRDKPHLFSFLDRISPDAVFWGIITLNGVVFVMWYMSTQRLVKSTMYHHLQYNLLTYTLTQKLQRDPGAYKWMVDNFTGCWRNLSSGRMCVFLFTE